MGEEGTRKKKEEEEEGRRRTKKKERRRRNRKRVVQVGSFLMMRMRWVMEWVLTSDD